MGTAATPFLNTVLGRWSKADKRVPAVATADEGIDRSVIRGSRKSVGFHWRCLVADAPRKEPALEYAARAHHALALGCLLHESSLGAHVETAVLIRSALHPVGA